jgi:tRNA/tmRNA/rRNA uracil-C5-methylase (TrmA/RlmC/RlmD family)
MFKIEFENDMNQI